MSLLWPPLPARCPNPKARCRGRARQQSESTCIDDGQGWHPGGPQQGQDSMALLGVSELEFQFKQKGGVACSRFQRLPNCRNETFSLRGPTCHVFLSSMTIQWSAWPSRSILNGTIFR